MNKIIQYARLALIGFLSKTAAGQALVAAVDAGQKFIADATIYSRKGSKGASSIEMFDTNEKIETGIRNLDSQKLNVGERAAIVGFEVLQTTGANAGQDITDVELKSSPYTSIDDSPVLANAEVTISVNGKDIVIREPLTKNAHNGYGDWPRGARLLDQPIYVTDTDAIKATIKAGVAIPKEVGVHFGFITAKVLA